MFKNRRHIPSATITAITKPATLQQRTKQGREAHILSIYSALKKTIEIAASAEESIHQNDNMYLPLFASTARSVHKLDILLPGLLIILATGLLLFSYVSQLSLHNLQDQLHKPGLPSLYYCLLTLFVQGCYLLLSRWKR